ncbi:serine hydrolase domain-containing protein [Niveispirillum fermenti]|uniref:serine hydrolase domain-containing protein n=1 Tax=Niveispirillum fermenti TaxID=1233113 RepID=UPI003A83F9E4
MPSRRLFLTGLAAGLLPLIIPVSAAPAQAMPADPLSPDLPQVTEQIQAAIRRHGLNGVAAIAHHGNRVLYRGYFGDIGPATPLEVASASKWIAGLVIMALVAQGRLRLDTSLAEAGLAGEGPKAGITLAQLMSHTSALPATGPVMQQRRYPTPRAAARKLADMDMIGQPGTVFAYAGVSMQVAAFMAEQAGGADWNSLFRRLIADPLGLSPACRWGDKWGVAGGLVASPDDYERLLLLIARQGLAGDGRRILPADIFPMMERDRIGTADRRGQPETAAAMKGYGIGLWCEAQAADGSCPVISSPGAFGTYPRLDRSRDLAILLMVRSRLPRVASDWRAVTAALVRAADGG